MSNAMDHPQSGYSMARTHAADSVVSVEFEEIKTHARILLQKYFGPSGKVVTEVWPEQRLTFL